jgi:integrase
VAKRGNGQGTVYQRKSDKKWIAAVTVGRRSNGKPKQVVRYARSKIEANAILKDLQKSHILGEIVSGGSVKVSDYLWQWLEGKKLEVRTQTIQSMRTKLKHIVTEIGDMRLDAVTPAHIRRAYRSALDHLSPRTLSVVHTHLQEAFKDAVEESFIAKNPMRSVPMPRWEDQERALLDPAQLGLLLAKLETHRHYALYALLAFTGIREGEAFALKWSDIDWDAGSLKIQRGLARLPGGGYVLGPLKTKGSRRRIKIVPTLLDALRHHQDRQVFEMSGKTWEEPGLVFAGLRGQPLNASLARNGLVAALQEAGLPPMRIHDLRHSFATIASSGNVQPQNLQRLMGHSNLSTTFGIYAAALEQIQDEAVQAVETAVMGRK